VQNYAEFRLENRLGKEYLEGLGVDGSMLLQLILDKYE
jgi:hypothetical protein